MLVLAQPVVRLRVRSPSAIYPAVNAVKDRKSAGNDRLGNDGRAVNQEFSPGRSIVYGRVPVGGDRLPCRMLKRCGVATIFNQKCPTE